MTNSPRIVGIVLARLDSSRLPGKALRDCAGLPLVGHAVARARRITGLAELVLATTVRACDEPLVEYARREKLAVFRGETDDVAGRVLACAREFGGAFVLRINGDSPFLDPALVDQAIRLGAEQPADLVTNLLGRTFPYGISVELVRTGALAEAWQDGTPAEREHVTRFFYEHPQRFVFRSFTSPRPELAAARLVVDTPEDLARFEQLAARLGPRLHIASFADVAELALSSVDCHDP